MFTTEGARIAIGALDDSNLTAAEKEIRSQTGGEVVVIPTDLTDSGQAKELVTHASERASYITGAAIQIDGGWYRGIM